MAELSTRSAVEAMRPGLARRELCFWLTGFLIATFAIHQLDAASVSALALSLASLNLIHLFAGFVLFHRLALSDGDRMADRLDWFAVLSLLAFLGLTSASAHKAIAGVAATVAAFYLLVRSHGDDEIKAAGAVLLAFAVNTVWAPQIFLFVGPEFLRGDAALVGSALQILRPDIAWNGLRFTTAEHGIVLVGACSSFNNISSALLTAVAMTMLLRNRWIAGDIAVAAAACAAMVAMNVARLCLAAWSAEAYQFWHDGSGAHFVALAQTVVLAVMTYFGATLAGRRSERPV